MPDQGTRRCALVTIIDHALEYVLGDRVWIFTDLNQRIARCPTCPPTHATDAYPALIRVGVDRLDYFILVQRTNDVKVRSRAFARVQLRVDAVPVPCHIARRRRGWR